MTNNENNIDYSRIKLLGIFNEFYKMLYITMNCYEWFYEVFEVIILLYDHINKRFGRIRIEDFFELLKSKSQTVT